LSKSVSLAQRHKDFDYLGTWMAELSHLRAQCVVVACCGEFEVRRKIGVRYDKIKSMSLEELLKKEREVGVLEDRPYSYSEQQLRKLGQVLSLVCQSVHCSLGVGNWLRLQSSLRLLCNLLTFVEATPFYHRGSDLYAYFAFLSLAIIEMLTCIRKHGFWQFKHRYNRKLLNTEVTAVHSKLQLEGEPPSPLFPEFVAEYYQPDLETSTTKTFWFEQEPELEMESLSAILAYTVNTLRLENKHQLLIGIVRDFCNATQHHYSLVLLPFMTSSQGKLLEDVEKMIQRESEALLQVQNTYNAEKQKMGKKRAYLMSGEKMDFERIYEEQSQKIGDSLRFLGNEKAFI
jgi:hypothetical protein